MDLSANRRPAAVAALLAASLLGSACASPSDQAPPARETGAAVCQARRTEAQCTRLGPPGVDAAGCLWNSARKLCLYDEGYRMPPPPLPPPPVRSLVPAPGSP